MGNFCGCNCETQGNQDAQSVNNKELKYIKYFNQNYRKIKIWKIHHLIYKIEKQKMTLFYQMI